MMMMLRLVGKAQMLIIIVQALVMATAKPMEETAVRIADSQPSYELQLTVWPTDIEDIVDALEDTVQDDPYVTIVEEPVVVMPDLDYDQDDDFYRPDYQDDDVDETQNPTEDAVQVLENYHISFANGTEEYKLVLSNGVVNYQRLDLKDVNGKLRPVQDGYYTIPSADIPASYHTTYYHADENGYNVYKTERSPRNPAHDVYLEYAKDQDAEL